jgi:leucyl-tRNA synthetase
MHLLYARFWTKVLYDLGLIKFTEPFPNLLNQGMVLSESKKMSKSRPGLVVGLKDAIERYGADALRVSELFAGPVEADIDWADVSVDGNRKWLARVWRLVLEHAERIRAAGAPTGDSPLRRATHVRIAAIADDYERFRFNTAIAKLHELTNAIEELGAGATDADVAEAVEALLVILSPIAPFITEELWSRLGREGSIHRHRWPSFNEALTTVDRLTMVVQVNGKVRDRIEVPAGIGEDEMREVALASEKIKQYVEGKQIVKIHVVPPKLVSIVVR